MHSGVVEITPFSHWVFLLWWICFSPSLAILNDFWLSIFFLILKFGTPSNQSLSISSKNRLCYLVCNLPSQAKKKNKSLGWSNFLFEHHLIRIISLAPSQTKRNRGALPSFLPARTISPLNPDNCNHATKNEKMTIASHIRMYSHSSLSSGRPASSSDR